MFATAKILIWKQFTTTIPKTSQLVGCVCNCKDTNLKAIHNLKADNPNTHFVVFATAKILIWKQFTTPLNKNNIMPSCVCNCKDTNLKAIHNVSTISEKTLPVVFATAKILIWKQFTTQP